MLGTPPTAISKLDARLMTIYSDNILINRVPNVDIAVGSMPHVGVVTVFISTPTVAAGADPAVSGNSQ